MLTGLSGLSGLSGVAGSSAPAPPAITVASVIGNLVTLTNAGGTPTSVNWGDGTTNTSLTRTYATQGVWTVTASNAAGSSSAIAIVAGYWLQASPYYCFSDAAGTIPCADGDAVRVWKDRTGNTVGQSQATSGSRPILRFLSSQWRVTYDGVSQFMAGTTAAAQPSGKNITTAWQGKIDNNVVMPFSRVDGSTPQWYLSRFNTAQFRVTLTPDGGVSITNVTASTAAVSLGTEYTTVGRYDGSNVRVSVDRNADATTASSLDFFAPTSTAPIETASNDMGFDRAGGYCRSALQFNVALSDGQKTLLLDALGVP